MNQGRSPRPSALSVRWEPSGRLPKIDASKSAIQQKPRGRFVLGICCNRVDRLRFRNEAAVEALPQARSQKTRREVETKLSAALLMVSHVAGKNPQAAAKVIQSVGDTATKNQAIKVSNTALMSLDRLAETNKVFAPAHSQLKTNISNTITHRYMLVRPQ